MLFVLDCLYLEPVCLEFRLIAHSGKAGKIRYDSTASGQTYWDTRTWRPAETHSQLTSTSSAALKGFSTAHSATPHQANWLE